MTAYAVSCAGATLSIVAADMPDDPRPAAAMEAARLFAGGGARSNLQRTAAADAHRAGREAHTQAASHAATATGDAAAAAYLHPLAKSSQVRHILGAAALLRGRRPVRFSCRRGGTWLVEALWGGFVWGDRAATPDTQK